MAAAGLGAARAGTPAAAHSHGRAALARSEARAPRPWRIAYLFLLPALAGLILFRALPIGIAVFGSLFSETLEGELAFKGLGNYLELAADPAVWESVRTTLVFNIIINPLQIAVAFALALLVAGSGRLVIMFRTAFFLPMTLSIGLTAILWNLMLDQTIGPVNALLDQLGIGRQGFFRSEHQALATMIGVATWKGAGYWMIFLLAGLYQISDELYEAATIDGASAWQRFRYVTLPLMRRPLAFVLVADTAVNFLFFAPVYIITRGGPNGATDLLMFRAYESAFTFGNWGRSLAISTILLLIIAAVAAVELRLLRSRGEGAT